jgi:hypothetical protein
MNRKIGGVRRAKIRKNRLKGSPPATLKAFPLLLSLKNALRVAGGEATVNTYSVF